MPQEAVHRGEHPADGHGKNPPRRGGRRNSERRGPMKYLIAGAGAIGAYLGARMARAGLDVTLFARGPHLRAMQENGVRVESAEGDFEARPRVIGNLAEAGPADIVFLAVKAQGLPELAPQLAPVLGPETTVVSTQNGVPW